MEMVQEQQLQLKINILLGYNMKTVVLWGKIKIGGTFFLVEENYPRLVVMMEFQ